MTQIDGGRQIKPASITADRLAAGVAGVTVQDENGNVGTGITQIDFQGAGVTATAGTGEVVVTIPGGGGGSAHTISDEGSALTARPTLDFQGAGVTATDDSPNNKTVVTIPAGATPWDLDWSKDGTSYTGFSTVSGTWSAGSYIACTAPGSGTFARSVISGTPWSLLGLNLLKWEIYIPSGQALGGSSGMVMFTTSAGANGKPIFRLDGSTSAITGATVENDGVSGLASKSVSYALDTWLTCHMLIAAGRVTGFVAGVPVVTHYADTGSPPGNTTIYPMLVSYQQAARFRNIKGYRFGGLP